MNAPYFVILFGQNGGATPLMEGDGLALFESRGSAFAAGSQNILGAHFGFEIHEAGAGE